MKPVRNPYEPTDLIESCHRAQAEWDAMTLDEQIEEAKRIGLLDANGKIHPDYDWTPERYAQQYGHAAK